MTATANQEGIASKPCAAVTAPGVLAMCSGLTRLLLILVTLSVTTGCKAVLKPSDKARHASYVRNRQLFTGQQTDVLRGTYFVFSGDSDLPRPGREPQSSLDRNIGEFSFARKTAISQGLAIGLVGDGYLLTAAHVLGDKNYILGWFDGKIDMKPARIVFKSGPKSRADFALIKTEAKLDHPIHFRKEAKVGEPAFAVVCYRKKGTMGGALDFAAGNVRNVFRDPSASLVDLINTDIPLWEGDSGGPLLSSKGQLIGITSGFVATWYGVYWKCQRIGVLPEKQFIDHLIARDRATHNAGSRVALRSPGSSSDANAAGVREWR